jgi:hypothetical protein
MLDRLEVVRHARGKEPTQNLRVKCITAVNIASESSGTTTIRTDTFSSSQFRTRYPHSDKPETSSTTAAADEIVEIAHVRVDGEAIKECRVSNGDKKGTSQLNESSIAKTIGSHVQQIFDVFITKELFFVDKVLREPLLPVSFLVGEEFECSHP